MAYGDDLVYAVTATVERIVDGWHGSRQIPTFYLLDMFSAETARKVALDIIDPYDNYLRVNVHVEKVS